MFVCCTPQVHGRQCLRCTYSTVTPISAEDSVCTAVRNPSQFVVVDRDPGMPYMPYMPHISLCVWVVCRNIICDDGAGGPHQPLWTCRPAQAAIAELPGFSLPVPRPGFEPSRGDSGSGAVRCSPGKAKGSAGTQRCSLCVGNGNKGGQLYQPRSGQSS